MSSPEPVPASRSDSGVQQAGAPGRSGRALVPLLLGAVLLVALMGPRARMGALTGVPAIGEDVDAYLDAAEAGVPNIRPGAQKGVEWADPRAREPTPWSVVYLHGFSADRHEVEPLVADLADGLGANTFSGRLTGHGRDSPAMGEATADAWLRDAAEAMEVGRAIGHRVLLIGTSTGGTLALWAAAQPELAQDLEALVLLSPNFHPRDRKARLLLWPWGGLIARMVEGPERCFETHNEAHARHWTECYPTSALLPMMALAEHVRTSRLEEIRTPTLVVYVPDDQVVDPRETEEAFQRLGAEPKALFAVEAPGDPERHVPAGAALSPASTDEVRRAIEAFIAGLAG